MYRVHCIRRADKENAASFMLRSLLLWTKMMPFSRERGGKCGRLSKVGDVVGVLGHSGCKESRRDRNYAELEVFSCMHSCLLRCKMLYFDPIDLNL